MLLKLPKGKSQVLSTPCNTESETVAPSAKGPTVTIPVAATGHVVVPSDTTGVPSPKAVTSISTLN